MRRLGDKVILNRGYLGEAGADVYAAYSRHFKKPVYIYKRVLDTDNIDLNGLVRVTDGRSDECYYKFLGDILSLNLDELYNESYTLIVGEKLADNVEIDSIMFAAHELNLNLYNELKAESFFELVQENQEAIWSLKFIELKKNKYFKINFYSYDGSEALEYFNEDEWEIIKK